MFKEMVDSGYFMYMAEAEGFDNLVNTKTARINAAIKDFQKLYRDGYDPNEYVHEVLSAHNLSEDLLTEKEIRRINSAI